MKVVEKILSKIESCIHNRIYEAVETEKVELKPTPANLASSKSIIESINAFLNTDGGIVIVGIYDNQKKKEYEIKGYIEDFEGVIKSFPFIFTDEDRNKMDLTEYLKFEIIDFIDDRICAIYVDKLPEDLKFMFYKGEAWERRLTGDHLISDDEIEKRKEFREDVIKAKEWEIIKDASINDIDLEKLNEYIHLLNKEIKTETIKDQRSSLYLSYGQKKQVDLYAGFVALRLLFGKITNSGIKSSFYHSFLN